MKTFEEQINYIKNLEDNWDGYGSPPISREVIENVEKLWKETLAIDPNRTIPELTPGIDNSISLTWKLHDGTFTIWLYKEGGEFLRSRTVNDKSVKFLKCKPEAGPKIAYNFDIAGDVWVNV